MHGTWKTTGGGGVVLVIIVGGIVLFAAIAAAARAVAAIPAYVWVLGALVLVAAMGTAVRLVVGLQRHEAAAAAAWHERRQALRAASPSLSARPAGQLPPAGQHLHIHLHGDVPGDTVARAVAAIRNNPEEEK